MANADNLGGERPITLRPARDADWVLIRRWLAQPEIQRWWGNLASAESEVRLALETPSAIARIVVAGAEPIGYAHAIDAAYWGSGLPDGMPAGTWDVDLFIAEPGHRGCGAGERALELLAEEVFTTTLAPALAVFVSVRNEAAVRAYERAGFAWARVWEDPLLGPSWMMLRTRPRR
jgi:aminoglycoside 6'-N-acetyltransferase